MELAGSSVLPLSFRDASFRLSASLVPTYPPLVRPPPRLTKQQIRIQLEMIPSVVRPELDGRVGLGRRYREVVQWCQELVWLEVLGAGRKERRVESNRTE